MSSSLTKKVAFLSAASLGTFLEFFDIALYGFFATHFAKIFFASGDSFINNLNTWLIFAVSYLFRPLGALIFGKLADVKGGKFTMVFSMSLMALSTSAIGFLPTYAAAGMLAPFLLFLCRTVQAIAVSPEYNLPSVFLKNNNWLQNRFGLASSISACVTGFGMMGASTVVGIVSNNYDLNQNFGLAWRLPFIASGVTLGTLGIYLRLKFAEEAKTKVSKKPFADILKFQSFDLVKGSLVAGYVGCISYTYFGFLGNQLTTVRGLTTPEYLAILNTGAFLPGIFSLIAGFLSDYIDGRKLMFFATLPICIFAYAIFKDIKAVESGILTFSVCGGLAALGFFAGSFPAFLADLFAKEYRYTGAFLSYNLGMSWVGGTTTFVFIQLAKLSKILPIYVIIFYSIVCCYLLWQSVNAKQELASEV